MQLHPFTAGVIALFIIVPLCMLYVTLFGVVCMLLLSGVVRTIELVIDGIGAGYRRLRS